MNNIDNKTIINNLLNDLLPNQVSNIYIPNNSPNLKTSQFILIDKTADKIKFCEENNNFSDSIDKVYEFNINDNVTSNFNLVTNSDKLTFYWHIQNNYIINFDKYENCTYNNIPFTYYKLIIDEQEYYLYMNLNTKIDTNILDIWLLTKNNNSIINDGIKSSVNFDMSKDESYPHINYISFTDYSVSFDYKINKQLKIKMFILLDNLLSNDKYLLLDIKEIDKNYEYATDLDIEKSFCILFPDYYNEHYYYLDSTHHEKIYDHSNLGNITMMTINYKNASGLELKTNYNNILDYDIKTPKDKCICTYNLETGEKIRNYQCSHSYLRHMGYEKLQNTLLFKVGILEGMQNIRHI
jgi:hypothetical protein